MEVQVIVTIDCDLEELREGTPFITASHFWRYDKAMVTIRKGGQSITISNSAAEGTWRDWRSVRGAWELIHGDIQ